MRPDSYYDNLQEIFDTDSIHDDAETVYEELRQDAVELGLMGMCDPKICDGTHRIATARGRFMWMILEMQKNRERRAVADKAIKSGDLSELKDVLESLGVSVNFVELKAKKDSQQETTH